MKKGLNIAANVCAIILMAILFVEGLVYYAADQIVIEDYTNAYGADSSEVAYLQFMLYILIAIIIFSIATIVVSALTLALGGKRKVFGLKLAVIILLAFVVVLEFCGGGVFFGILCLIPICLEIASLATKEEPKGVPFVPEEENSNVESNESNDSNDQQF